MAEKRRVEEKDGGGPKPHQPQSLPKTGGKIPQIIASLSRIIEKAVTVRRGEEAFLEVPNEALRRVVEELRHVVETAHQEQQQAPHEDAITRILKNIEDIKSHLAV